MINEIEEKIIHSFKMAKSDIIKVQNAINHLNQRQEKLMEMIKDLEARDKGLEEKINIENSEHRIEHLRMLQKLNNVKDQTKKIKERKIKEKKAKAPVKTIVIKASAKAPAGKHIAKTYVAAKGGKKFHVNNCPFAQNIKPKSKVTFRTKAKPLNLGYKPCNCVK